MRHQVSISVLLAIAMAFEPGMHARTASAQSSGGTYRMNAVIVAAGGGTLSGGPLRLRGTFGQTADNVLSASAYRLDSGFWSPDDEIFHGSFEVQ